MCPNCALNLAAIGPGYWAAFFVLGVFTLLGGYLYFLYGWGTGEDHVATKLSILDCEEDDVTNEEARHG